MVRTVAAILTLLASISVMSACAGRSAVFGSGSNARDAPFTVVHRAPTGRPLAHPPFRYMDYYRTEVRNVSNRPLKIVWFEGYGQVGDAWRPGNVLGRVLREEEFSAWYTEGDATNHGIIGPHETAVCDVNWHGSNSPAPANVKWAFIAVD